MDPGEASPRRRAVALHAYGYGDGFGDNLQQFPEAGNRMSN